MQKLSRNQYTVLVRPGEVAQSSLTKHDNYIRRYNVAGISKTVLQIQPGKVDEAVEFIKSVEARASELDGITGFGLAITGENEITVIGVYDNTAAANAAASLVQEVFGELASIIAGAPDRGVFEGIWFSV